jgi:hypothetical protein
MLYLDSDDGTFMEDSEVVVLDPRVLVYIFDIIRTLAKNENENDPKEVPASFLINRLLHAYISEMREKTKKDIEVTKLTSDLDGKDRKIKYLESLLQESLENGGKIKRAVSPYYYRPAEDVADDPYLSSAEVISQLGGDW